MRTQRAFLASVYVACTALFCLGLPVLALAQPSAADSAGRVPIDVVEVVSGGNWEQGTARGFWRVLTVMVPDALSGTSPRCEVLVQWIGSRTSAAPYEIIAFAPLTQFNALGLSSASVALETEGERVGRVVVTGEDSNHVLTLMAFQVRSPGFVVTMPLDDPVSLENARSAEAKRVGE